jgi:hypothetical protein
MMELSVYTPEIDLEDTICEFDAATSELNSDRSIENVHNVVVLNRRWLEALEDKYRQHDWIDRNLISRDLINRYQEDSGRCIKILNEMHKNDNGVDYSMWLSIMELSVDKSRDLIQKMDGYDA